MPKNYLKRFNFNNLPGIVVGELKLLVTTLHIVLNFIMNTCTKFETIMQFNTKIKLIKFKVKNYTKFITLCLTEKRKIL